MSGIETVGGCCPNCKNVLLQKFESSGYGLIFDLCISCGFYFDDNGSFKPEAAANVIAIHINYHSVDSLEALQNIYKDHKGDPEKDDFYPSIYNYSTLSKQDIEKYILDFSKVDWKKEIDQVQSDRNAFYDETSNLDFSDKTETKPLNEDTKPIETDNSYIPF